MEENISDTFRRYSSVSQKIHEGEEKFAREFIAELRNDL